jgi:hypothetical protein
MSVLRRSLLVLVLLLAVAAVGLATLPAAVAYRWFGDRFGAIRLQGLSGTVWHGHAANLTVFEQALGALDWSLHPWPLLRHSVVADLVLGSGAVGARGRVVVEADGTVRVQDAVFRLPAQLAAPVLDIPALQLHGEIEVGLDHAQLRGAGLEAAAGHVVWHAAAVSGAAQAELGELEADFTTADGAIVGTVRDRGGPLQLQGRFRVTAADFVAEARLAARDDNPNVREALRYIGEVQADGSSHLVIHGQLFRWL